MNKELLFSLYAIHSESGNEKKMRRFVRKYINENCGDVTMETDAYGNLLCVKGQSKTYPCLAAHLDQVQHFHSNDFRAVETGGDVLGWSPKCHKQQGLGADDKNGIFICLELLKRFDVLKVAFFVGEEVGCKGSSKVDLEFFKDCRFIVEPDRRGASDLITSMFCGRVCSDGFIEAIGAEAFGYREATGSITDVGELVERGVGISCLNLSCGYYEAHSDEEITVLSDLENCLNFVGHIVETCVEVYPFEGGYGGYNYGYGRYGLHDYNYGYNYYGGKKYESSKLSPCKTMSEKEFFDEEWDEEQYFKEGYYEEDVSTMEEYLQIQPDLTFSQIWSQYGMDFNAVFYLDGMQAENQLKDIYDFIRDDVEYDHGEFWGEDDEDGPVMEPSLPFKEMKKVS